MKKALKMDYVSTTITDGVAIVTFCRGKVNALNPDAVHELRETFQFLSDEPDVRAVILTGAGKFFSFGFDIPFFLNFSKDEFTQYLEKFTALYFDIFSYPKPVIAALNGHAIAGGCMLALACDFRIMVNGNAKISLNEIEFGSSVFAGSVEMLRFWIGGKNAQQVLYSGAMFTASEAERIGLIDKISTTADINNHALTSAKEFIKKDQAAFHNIKMLLREAILDKMQTRDSDSIKDMVEIWYSPSTWKQLQGIKIRD